MKLKLLASLLVLTMSLSAQEEWLTIESGIIVDVVSNIDGGVEKKTALLSNLDLNFAIDTVKADLWDNGSFFVYFLGNYGDEPSIFIGDRLVTNNIEAPDTIKLYEAWYQHQFNDISLLVGLHDYNSEFDTLESKNLFIHDSFGTQSDISQVGPSVFPTTALAVRLAWEGETGLYARVAMYDGIAGSSTNDHGTHINLEKEDGLFYAFEVGQVTDNYKVALGNWIHTAEVTDYAGSSRDFNRGTYLIGEYFIQEDLSVFLQLASTLSDRNEIGSFLGAGVHTKNLFTENDEAGIAIVQARLSKDYKKANNLESAESAFEITYAYNITSHFSVQPAFQYVINPSMNPDISNASVAVLRVSASY